MLEPHCDSAAIVEIPEMPQMGCGRDKRFFYGLSAVVLVILLTQTGLGQEVRPSDPRLEGWLSESFSLHAEQQLKRLGTLMTQAVSSNPLPVDLSSLLTEDFTCESWRPAEPRLVYDSREVKVLRAQLRDSRPQRYNDLSRPLQELVKPFDHDQDRRISFKVIQLDAKKPEHPTTRVYASHVGNGKTGLVEQSFEWTVVWDGSIDSTSPRIHSIAVESFEEIQTSNRHDKKLFHDATAGVFRDVDSFWKQLAFDQVYWQRRIEGYHVIFKSAQHGLAVGDADGDGWDDVYVCQPGGLPNRLFLRDRTGSVRDASEVSRTDLLDSTRSALFIDFDNDGDQDLVLAMSSGLLFYQNYGRARFRPTKVIPAIGDAYSLAASDFDNDGDVDIYACRYYPKDANTQALPIPTPYSDANNGGKNFLVRNDGNWRTSDATSWSGLDENNSRFSYAAIWGDFDSDGDQDLYVANDFGRNCLYRNEIDELGRVRFTDQASQLGLEDGAFGMSASAGDFDQDGYEDIYVGNMFSAAGSRVTMQPQFKPDLSMDQRVQFQRLTRGNTLFKNQSGRYFRDVSARSGATLGRWSWGSLFADINNDGWQDLLIANGYITGDDPNDDL